MKTSTLFLVKLQASQHIAKASHLFVFIPIHLIQDPLDFEKGKVTMTETDITLIK